MKKETKICTVCGKEYQRPRGLTREKWETRKYCSRECYDLASKTIEELLEKKCKYCGKVMVRRETEAKHAFLRKQFCSPECARRHVHSEGYVKPQPRTLNIWVNNMSDVMRHADK